MMSDKKYPYIAKLKEYPDRIVLFVGKGVGAPLTSWWGDLKYMKWDESDFVDNTYNFLQGKCVKVESVEHCKFIQELAFNAGIMWCGHETSYRHLDADWLYFNGKYLTFTIVGEELLDESEYDDHYNVITIPLPPKDAPKLEFKVGDGVCV